MSTVLNSSAKMRGRLSASQINAMKPGPSEFSLNSSGANAHIPIVYGRRVVPGIRVTTVENVGALYCLVVWCLGEVHSIEEVYIDGEAPVYGVELRHYRGTTYQGVDEWLADAIPGYDDDLILRKPSGDVGIAYTVAKIPATYEGSPRFQAVIKGKIIFDPGSSSTGDPFYDDVALAVHFTGADGSTSATDTSTNARTITFNGSSQILSNHLDAGGSGGGVTIADSAAIEFADQPWSVEITANATTLTGFAALLWKSSTTSSDLGFYLLRSENDLAFSASSNGTSYNIMSGVVVGTNVFVSGVDIDILVEFTGTEYVFSIDGVETYRHASTLKIYDNGLNWYVGINNVGTGPWQGGIRSLRMTIGALRYGAPVPVGGSPFFDDGSYTAGYTYSDNTALVFGDVATSALYGAGSSVSGLAICKAWDDADISPAIPRSKIGITLAAPQKTEQVLDLLATYGEFRYIYEGSTIRMIPDKLVDSDNPSGPELVTDSTPETTDETVVTDAGAVFVVTLVITSRVAGSVSVDFDGVTVIDAETAAGTYAVKATATGATADITVNPSVDWDGVIASISVRRLYALHENWVGEPPSLVGLDSDDAPTKVTINYVVPSDDSPDWREASVSYTLPEAASGLVPLVETVVSLPSIYRPAEAAYKAKARVLRMVNRVQLSGVVPDSGLSLIPGSVIQARRSQLGIDMLAQIDSWEMVEYGRYRISGMRYDISHYPAEIPLPENTTTVPVGAILPLAPLSSVPSGWEVFDAADGKFIRIADAADSDFFVGETGGTTTHAGFSGNTNTGGGHIGFGAYVERMRVESLHDAGEGSESGNVYEIDYNSVGGHVHTYATGTITPDILRRENVLIRKTGTAGALVPAAAMAFGFGLSHANLSRSTSFQGRLIQAAANGADEGLSPQWIGTTTGNANDLHDHFTVTAVTDGVEGPLQTIQKAVVEAAGGVHSHGLLFAINVLPQKYKLALYSGTDDYPVIPGMVFLWNGSLASLPTDFYLLDGQDGRADLRKHFIEIAGVGEEGTSTGDNTISVGSYTYDAGAHDHQDGATTEDTVSNQLLWHASTVTHNHNTINNLSSEDSAAYVPPYYVLAAIVYLP